jgi:single-strand DNA-binding protein
MSTIPPGTNVSVLAGSLTRPPEWRELPSGTALLVLDLRLPGADGPAESVAVTWFDPPPGAAGWLPGEEVVVLGRVRRRFFRAGGGTQSRTDVVAQSVVPARQRSRAAKLVDRAREQLQPG